MANNSMMRKGRPNLGNQIRKTLIESAFDKTPRKFSPEGSLDALITTESVIRTFCKKPPDPSDPIFSDQASKELADFVVNHGKKLFAISILTNFKHERLRGVIELFRNKGINDNDLPFEESSLKLIFSSTLEPSEYVENEVQIWDDDDDIPCDVEHFIQHQDEISAPVFSSLKVHSKLHRHAILPFIEKDPNSGDKGSFGNVSKYKIHQSHLYAPDLDLSSMKYVAIKEIELDQGPGGISAHFWEKEVTALWKMKELNQAHIVKFITAFRRGDDGFYLMFEWANGGNLRNLWKHFPRSRLTGDLVKATFQQLLGLAQALDTVHDGEGSRDKHTRHGDLKPENILWFKDKKAPDAKLGMLKIGDWGLAKEHQVETEIRNEQTTTRHGTRRYEAPEEVTDDNASLKARSLNGNSGKKRSRLYDIWAMGCIALEFLIWLMYGPSELERFNESIVQGRSHDEPFYIVDSDGKAKVHSVVVRWMDQIAKDLVYKPGATALGSLLELIRDKLLVVALPDGLGSAIDLSKQKRSKRTKSNFRGPTAALTPDSSDTSSTSANMNVAIPSIVFSEPGTESNLQDGGFQADFVSRPLATTSRCRARTKDFLDRMEEISSDDQPDHYWFSGDPQPLPRHILKPSESKPKVTKNTIRGEDDS